MKIFKIAIVLLVFICYGNIYAQNTFKIIVNEKNSTTTLTVKEASDLFLKKKTKWADGVQVMPVDAGANSPVREAFSRAIHGKGTSAIRSFWQQAVFSGTASAPPEKATDEEIISFIKKNPGAIGYISSSTKAEGITTIKIN